RDQQNGADRGKDRQQGGAKRADDAVDDADHLDAALARVLDRESCLQSAREPSELGGGLTGRDAAAKTARGAGEGHRGAADARGRGWLAGPNGMTNPTSRIGVTKPGASTPITAYSSPFSRTSRPRTLASAPKRRDQKRSVRTTTWSEPGRSSAGCSSRPSRGRAPRTSKKFPVARSPCTRSPAASSLRLAP